MYMCKYAYIFKYAYICAFVYIDVCMCIYVCACTCVGMAGVSHGFLYIKEEASQVEERVSQRQCFSSLGRRCEGPPLS